MRGLAARSSQRFGMAALELREMKDWPLYTQVQFVCQGGSGLVH